MVSKVLITGGAGFIGHNLIKHLESHNFHVCVVDNFSRGSRSFLDASTKVFEGDIGDINFLEKSFEGIDCVIHLAAYGSVIESIENPIINFSQNALGTLNVLEAARRQNVKKVIFSSTGGAIMGDTPPPVNEKSLPAPISPYGSSKLCGEAYMKSYAESFDIDTVSLRFGNIYGPGSSLKRGVITLWIKSLMKDKEITIYGDGNSSRDYLYVNDLCEGIAMAVKKNISGASIFHLSSGEGTSLNILKDMLEKISEKKFKKVTYKDLRKGEVIQNFANFNKAKEVLGFIPKTTLQDGLSETYKWFKDLNAQDLNNTTFDS